MYQTQNDNHFTLTFTNTQNSNKYEELKPKLNQDSENFRTRIIESR